MPPLLVALILLLGGLGVCWLSSSVPGIAGRIMWWIGFLVACLGAVWILAPILNFIARTLKEMLDAHDAPAR
jgi:hypothetical protein